MYLNHHNKINPVSFTINTNCMTKKVIGVMSGTSLDGMDIAFCTFTFKNKKWAYSIKAAQTVKYNRLWKESLSGIENKSAIELARLNVAFGKYIGREVKKFIVKLGESPDLIASHGHTIFHQPKAGITLQIGSGAEIAAVTETDTICDFRTLDVALGGQGAPLVPIGDELLFKNYDACLNIGGFANISYHKYGKRIAFDICPANIVLNKLAGQLNKDYDKGGLIAKKGHLDENLFEELNQLNYYKTKAPKSLGKEWVLANINPLISKKLSTKDLLNTCTEHIAYQIAKDINGITENGKVLITGGGAFNSYLISCIAKRTKTKLVIPSEETVNFKEALIFAFLGLLRQTGQTNTLKSVTGARQNSSGGAYYKGLSF